MPPDDEMRVSDYRFAYFLANVLPSDLSEKEWRLYKFCTQR